MATESSSEGVESILRQLQTLSDITETKSQLEALEKRRLSQAASGTGLSAEISLVLGNAVAVYRDEQLQLYLPLARYEGYADKKSVCDFLAELKQWQFQTRH